MDQAERDNMMQDYPDDHKDYTVAFCIYKRIGFSQLNNIILALTRAALDNLAEH